MLGECWAGQNDDIKYDKLGRTDQKCVTSDYDECPANPKATERECVGKQWANYVYGIEMTRGNYKVKPAKHFLDTKFR